MQKEFNKHELALAVFAIASSESALSEATLKIWNTSVSMITINIIKEQRIAGL